MSDKKGGEGNLLAAYHHPTQLGVTCHFPLRLQLLPYGYVRD